MTSTSIEVQTLTLRPLPGLVKILLGIPSMFGGGILSCILLFRLSAILFSGRAQTEPSTSAWFDDRTWQGTAVLAVMLAAGLTLILTVFIAGGVLTYSLIRATVRGYGWNPD